MHFKVRWPIFLFQGSVGVLGPPGDFGSKGETVSVVYKEQQ